MSQRASTLDFNIEDSNFGAYANDEESISKIEKLKASKKQVKDYKPVVGKALTFNVAIDDEKEKRTNSDVGCA